MTKVSKYYSIEGNKLTRNNRTCPKCGPSVFLADHYDRWSCGKCGYTTFKRKKSGAASTGQRRRRTTRSPRKRSKSN